MPRVYRHQYAGGRLSQKWYIEFRNHAGKLCRRKGYRSKELTINLLAETLKREERIAAGLDVEPTSEPLAELLDRWKAYTLGRGAGETHAINYRRCVDRVVKWCGFFDCRSLNAARAQDFLDGMVAKGRTNRTYQMYRAALMAFGNWLAKKEKLIASNPFTAIDKRDPNLNCKIVRRALTDAEFKRLLAAAKSGPRYRGLSGESRYHLYLTAAYTGLRFGALCQLTPGSFDLGKSPSVSSSARLQKNRKPHVVPLPTDVAAVLRKWLKGRPVDAPIWPRASANRKGFSLLRFDLKAAGIPYKTAEGQFDFHALRHQYATALVRSGASPVEVQHLLDHCSPVLTARYFRHLRTDELRKPVNKLPKL